MANQVFAEDQGLIDHRLILDTSLQAIFEAELGWGMPAVGKLERYLPRLLRSPAQTQLLVSVSAADAPRMPPAAPGDRGWHTQMINHLQYYEMTSNVFDPRACLVFLREGGSPHSLSARSICRIQFSNFTAQLSNTQMAINKPEIYAHLRATCDELRGDVIDAAPSFVTCEFRDSALANDEAKIKRVAIVQQHKIHQVRSL